MPYARSKEILLGSRNRGFVVLRGKDASCQLSPISTRSFGSENIHQIKSRFAGGQYISSWGMNKMGGTRLMLPKSPDDVSPINTSQVFADGQYISSWGMNKMGGTRLMLPKSPDDVSPINTSQGV